MFPLVLDLTGRLVVVVGGGAVGRRKAAAVLAAGARVRLICLEPRPTFAEHYPPLDWRTEPYNAGHLDGAALVFASGPAAVNAQVVAEARARGIWVNSATDPDAGDFHVPAALRRGAFMLAVSTGGAAPALAREVRARLGGDYDAAFGTWVELLAELRPIARKRIADPGRRRRVLEGLCGWGWLERLRSEGAEAVRAAMLAEVEAAGS